MEQDEIIREIRQIREAFAARFDYGVEKMGAYLREQERASGQTLVSLPPKRVAPRPEPAAAQ